MRARSKWAGLGIALGLTLLAVSMVFVAGSLSGPTASADGGPHQGGSFSQTPDECAACHRIHTGQGPKLLGASSVSSLCLTCHGSAAAGSDANVIDGLWEGTGPGGLRGGGFTNALMDTSLTGTPTSAASTSQHTTDNSNGTAWGGGAIGSGAGTANVSLECANCHNPHGNGQYRILRKKPLESGAASDVLVADSPGNYAITYNTQHERDTSYAPATIGDWCAQCHTRYLAGSGSATTPSGDAIFKYRHMTNGLTAECLKCHVAHGTTATMGSWSGAKPWPDNAAGGGSGDSRLLHIDNRGVCAQGCHSSIVP